MADLAFHDNFGDQSDGNGFQFEFFCESCHDAWRTPYERYSVATASNLLGAAGSLLGGILGSAGNLADRARDAGWRKAHDAAFAVAVEQAQQHFHRCRRCHNYFCASCYNPQVQLCIGCAPSVEDEANVAARSREIELAQARAVQQVEKGKLSTDDQVRCPHCDARVQKAKFCAECGGALAAKAACGSCGAELAAGAKFCAECGAKQG